MSIMCICTFCVCVCTYVCLGLWCIYRKYIHHSLAQLTLVPPFTADQWRVSLKDERPNYIHACFACDHRQKEAFIIAQAPLEGTCRDFWKMVHERQCGAIVMLSGPVEEGMVGSRGSLINHALSERTNTVWLAM